MAFAKSPSWICKSVYLSEMADAEGARASMRIVIAPNRLVFRTVIAIFIGCAKLEFCLHIFSDFIEAGFVSIV